MQIFSRIKKYFFEPKINAIPTPILNKIDTELYYYIPRQSSMLSSSKFNFLNVTKSFSLSNFWNVSSQTKLWLYNLHYFDGLLNAETPTELKQSLIHKWILQNELGTGNGWEPYPSSLRIINWIKWHLSDHKLDEEAIRSLAIQVEYLTLNIEYHLQGNHLFANAKALLIAGVFFKGHLADKWFSIGYEILEKQIPEQFLDDGAHFELSPTYHALLTEDLLDIIQFMKMSDKPIPYDWKKVAENAINWLSGMTRPDGLPPLFNDAAYGISPLLKDIISYGKAIGISEPEIINSGITDFSASGYFRYEDYKYSLFGDAGQIGPDYIPGHAHCDMLNFELFAHGKPIVVDTGTSTYEIGSRRQIERSTSSHNTVQIENFEQSEIWGAFRVARRAKISKRKISPQSVVAAYKGYQNTVHQRKFEFHEDHIIIQDEIYDNKNAVARMHFHPDITVKITDNIITAGSIKIEITKDANILLKKYHYAPEFNKLIEADLLEVSFKGYLNTKIKI